MSATNDQSYTVEEFLQAERLSRGMLYKLWAQGNGPRYFKIGSRRRISHEARIEWRSKAEAEAATPGIAPAADAQPVA